MKRKAQALNEASEDEIADESDEQTSETSSGSGADGSELEGSESDSGSDGKSEVDVDFEFFDPQEVDFHGLKALLQTYLDGSTFNCSELVDTVIKQTWGDAHAGLLVSERLVNAPPQLAPPLNQALFDEIEWAQDDEPTQELRDSFKLNLYILVSRVFTDPSAPGAVPKKKQKAGKAQEAVIVYARPEDEYYHKHCSWSYRFPVTSREVEEDELQPLRMVVGITAKQAASAR
ncbi:hypothetical protein ABBQ38_009454 [Trebouxia sp. C0009 RCD-2024]